MTVDNIVIARVFPDEAISTGWEIAHRTGAAQVSGKKQERPRNDDIKRNDDHTQSRLQTEAFTNAHALPRLGHGVAHRLIAEVLKK